MTEVSQFDSHQLLRHFDKYGVVTTRGTRQHLMLPRTPPSELVANVAVIVRQETASWLCESKGEREEVGDAPGRGEEGMETLSRYHQ